MRGWPGPGREQRVSAGGAQEKTGTAVGRGEGGEEGAEGSREVEREERVRRAGGRGKGPAEAALEDRATARRSPLPR